MRSMRLAPLALTLALVGCGTPGSGGGGGVEEPTWHRDIRPIIEGRCVSCHSDGNIAPFTLDSYEQVSVLAHDVAHVTAERIMPPVLAAPGCNDYVDDRTLTDEQIATIGRWVEQGTPLGDERDFEGPLPLPGDGIPFGAPDVSLEMPEPYTPTREPDDYRCFVLDWPATETRWVTGFQPRPGNLATVHHIIAYAVGPADAAEAEALDAGEAGQGYTCFGGPRASDQPTWLGSWAPGASATAYPPGTGLRMEPGSKVVLQVHYNTLNGTESDRTAVDFTTAPSVERPAAFLLWVNFVSWLRDGGMHIPANDPDVMHAFAYDPTAIAGFFSEDLSNDQPIEIHAAGHHMHQLGTSAYQSVLRGSGSEECLLDIPRWDFEWQGAYGFKQPVRIESGDQLYMECHWDNSAGNQPWVDGEQLESRDVYWGDGTQDEMCLGIFYITNAG